MLRAPGKARSIPSAVGWHALSSPEQLRQIPWESGALDDPSVQERKAPPSPLTASGPNTAGSEAEGHGVSRTGLNFQPSSFLPLLPLFWPESKAGQRRQELRLPVLSFPVPLLHTVMAALKHASF